jgi:hypothetical protein
MLPESSIQRVPRSRQQLNLALLVAAALIAGSVSVGGVLLANSMSKASDGKATIALPPPSSPEDHIRYAAATMDDAKSFDAVSEVTVNGRTVTETDTWDLEHDAMKSTTNAYRLPMEVVVDLQSGKAYAKIPELKREDPSKPWGPVVDPQSMGVRAGEGFGMSGYVSALRNVQDMGQMVSNEKAATRYSFDIDRDAYVNDPRNQSDMTDAIRALDDVHMFGEIWIDDDHHVVLSTMGISKAGAGSVLAISQTFGHFDSALKVTLPKSNEISKQTVTVGGQTSGSPA